LPVRRVASTSASPIKSPFAAMLQNAAATNKSSTSLKPGAVAAMATGLVHAPMIAGGGLAPVSRSEIVSNAQRLMNVPYVWGGNTSSGLDCSAFISKAWGIGRQSTDTLATVARPIAKDDLQVGDALNLTTARDVDGTGHVRLFDRWANPEQTKLWVYEETPPKSVHHVINWDPTYTPMRRTNTID
jgi:cell wall-associated NlpC family hydrolase